MKVVGLLYVLFFTCIVAAHAVSVSADKPESVELKSLTDALVKIQESLNRVETRLAAVEEENEMQRAEIDHLKEQLSTCESQTLSKTDVRGQTEVSGNNTNNHSEKNRARINGAVQNRIRRAVTPMDVAFFAKLKTEVHNLGLNQDITFDEVVTNVGNAYNPNHGVFVAPVSGVYVFSTTVLTFQHDYAHFAFALNGQAITIMLTNGPDSGGDSDSQTIVLHLNKGDDISIKNILNGNNGLYGGGHSIFSGFLLPSVTGFNEIVG